MASTPNLALLILLLVFAAQVVTWVGKNVLQEAAFSLYARVFLAKAEKDQRRLRKQVLDDKAELGRTSSQAEFAKWAKLKRKLDKGIADLERTNAVLSTSRASFASRFSTILWTITTGAQLVLVWWYRRQPVFWLPQGWVPGPLEYVLRFPSAPRGSVSVGAWSTVCKQALGTAEGIVKTLMTPVPPAPTPMAVPVPGQAPAGAKIQEIESDKLD